MKRLSLFLLSFTALACCAAAAVAQSGMGHTLPSEQLGQGGFGNVTNASRFSSRSKAPTGDMASQKNAGAGSPGGIFGSAHFNWDINKITLVAARLKSINSFALAERTRFSRLQQASLDLTVMVGAQALARPKNASQAFYQFIFPFGLRDKPAEYGYGYYSAAAIQQNIIRSPKEFLAEFSEEMQQTLADEKFLQAVAAMTKDGKMPQGRRLEELDDSQLAALGNYLFSNRKYPAAAQVWQALAKLDPSSSLFAQAAGQALFAARKFPEAAVELRRSLVAAKGWGTPAFRLSGINLQSIYTNADDLAEARAALEGRLTVEPNNPQLSFLMAYIDLFHGLWDRAEKRLTRLAADGDDTAAKLLDVLKTNRLAATIQRPLAEDAGSAPAGAPPVPPVELTPAERQTLVNSILDPKTFDDYMARGDYNFFMGNYARASDAYQTAVAMKPDSAIARFAQAHAAFANGEYDFAALTLRQALTMEPNWGLANFRLSELFGDRKDLDERTLDLEHLNLLRHDDPAAQFLLAYVYYFDGRYDDAAQLFSKLDAESPDYKVADPLLKLARLQS
jgi:tetratricopeptide (TPR) repeat protein